MANKEQYLSRDGVSHLYLLIKSKLTNYFKTLFVSKKDGYDLSQNDFTNELKTKLENINGSGSGSVEGAVLYTEQELTDEEQAQARENIGAGTGTWADMPDKPFGEMGAVIKMPNEIPENAVISSQPLDAFGGIAFSYVKVESALNSENEILGAQVSAYINGADVNFEVTSENIVSVDRGFVVLHIGEQIFLPACLNVTSVGTVTLPFADGLGEDLIFDVTEEKGAGLYFLCIEGMAQVNSIALNSIKKIDSKYLPEGLVTTDENGLISASVLPSYVDDVIEGYYNEEDSLFYKEAEFITVITGESGKIYVDVANGNTYRWSGSVFVKLESSSGLAPLSNTEIDEIIASVDSSIE